MTLTSASFDGSDPTTYSAGETVNFVLDAVWDPGGGNGDLSYLDYNVNVRLVGGPWTAVLPYIVIGYTPGITSPGGLFQITGSFTQPTDIPGDWEIQIIVRGRG